MCAPGPAGLAGSTRLLPRAPPAREGSRSLQRGQPLGEPSLELTRTLRGARAGGVVLPAAFLLSQQLPLPSAPPPRPLAGPIRRRLPGTAPLGSSGGASGRGRLRASLPGSALPGGLQATAPRPLSPAARLSGAGVRAPAQDSKVGGSATLSVWWLGRCWGSLLRTLGAGMSQKGTEWSHLSRPVPFTATGTCSCISVGPAARLGPLGFRLDGQAVAYGPRDRPPSCWFSSTPWLLPGQVE